MLLYSNDIMLTIIPTLYASSGDLFFFFFFCLTFTSKFPASGQAVISGVVPSVLIAHRVHSAFPLLVNFHRLLMYYNNHA